jgi:5'-3' exonuclease
MKILIDGDILTYRAAFSREDSSFEDACDKIDELVEEAVGAIAFDSDSADYEMFITGKGNFRFEVQPTYKQNRSGKPKPQHLQGLREYLIEAYDANVSVGEEADDVITIRATELGGDAVIASIDKDFLQVPCWHYNLNRGTLVNVTEFEGLRFFYGQILTGDTADNVFGLKGIGPVKSTKMLAGATTEQELYDICVDAYDGDTKKVTENARLLWLRRKEGEIWQPPEVN